MSEEDQMMRAIAMSLGQEVSMEQRSDSPEVCHPHYSDYMGKKTFNSELLPIIEVLFSNIA